MENFSDSGSVTLICKSCGHITTGTVKVSIATDLDIAGFNTNIFGICNRCGKMSAECGDEIAKALSILISKNYDVADHFQGEWGDGLFNPYIKIRTGLDKLQAPKGWRDVTGPGVNSFQVFSPVKSYGTSDDMNIENYITCKVFETEEEFIAARDKYLHKLEKWAEELPENTSISTLQSLSARGNVIDLG